jgi:hypothetical protein
MPDPNPKEDELAGTEQPFVQHLMELRDRLIRAVLAVGVVAAVLAIYPGPGALYDLLAEPLVAALPQGATMIAAEDPDDGGVHDRAAGGALPGLGVRRTRPVLA